MNLNEGIIFAQEGKQWKLEENTWLIHLFMPADFIKQFNETFTKKFLVNMTVEYRE